MSEEENQKKTKFSFQSAIDSLKGTVYLIGAVWVTLVGFLWLAEPRIIEYLQANLESKPIEFNFDESFTINDNNGRNESISCTLIPNSGHYVRNKNNPASNIIELNSWAIIEWNNIERLRPDCGIPVVNGVIVNGNGIYHEAPLSISGISLSVGSHSIRYEFQVLEGLEPGPSKFRVEVSFPNAVGGAPITISPWVAFTLIEPVETVESVEE
jgi:hypothetical protein